MKRENIVTKETVTVMITYLMSRQIVKFSDVRLMYEIDVVSMLLLSGAVKMTGCYVVMFAEKSLV